MSKTLKLAALSALALAAGNVYADQAETKGGIKIKSADGRFEASIGGRIHLDHYSFSEDTDARIGTTAYGSATLANRGATNFRRARLTLQGKAYGWSYKFEEDFSATAPTAGFRELWIGTTVGPGELILGQHKPFRGMEELTSSNDIMFMERPNTTATGIYASQFVTGAFYKGTFAEKAGGYGVYAASLANSSNTTEGNSYGARVFYAPISGETSNLHLGLAYSTDREDAGSANAAAVFNYGGRRGATLGLGNAGTAVTSGFGTQNTIHGEIAYSFGPATIQAEYAKADIEKQFDVTGGPQDSDAEVTAYYVQGSYMVTGESKPYKKGAGMYGNPKAKNAYGAVEVAVRYEASENKDTTTGAARGCNLAGVAAGSYQKCEGSQVTVGANWYVNPNTRFMLNYYMPVVEVNSTSEDKPDAVSLRAQFSF